MRVSASGRLTAGGARALGRHRAGGANAATMTAARPAGRGALAYRSGRSDGVAGIFNAAALDYVAILSRGRLTAAHDQLRYVIRKPESHFARLL
jgi:hypothetical protein